MIFFVQSIRYSLPVAPRAGARIETVSVSLANDTNRRARIETCQACAPRGRAD
jgi:hypothetical protein